MTDAIQLDVRILPQPDDSTCGPTSLHAVYAHFGDYLPLDHVIAETPTVAQGGTLAVLLATHALARKYRSTIYTYNLRLFDPSWFRGATDLEARLRAQSERKPKDDRLREAGAAYVQFLRRGGRIAHRDLTPGLIESHVARGIPMLTGLSATYLYGSTRELPDGTADDLGGEPVGHFVIVCGMRAPPAQVLIADPWQPNPLGGSQRYWVSFERFVGAVMLGVVTYDANLLAIEPGGEAL